MPPPSCLPFIVTYDAASPSVSKKILSHLLSLVNWISRYSQRFHFARNYQFVSSQAENPDLSSLINWEES